MPYEFVAKNGLISQGNITATGSLAVTQNISASRTGSFGAVAIGTNNLQDSLTIGSSISESLLIQNNTYNNLSNGVQITTHLGFLNTVSPNLNFARWTGGSNTDFAGVGLSSGPASYDLQFVSGRQNTGSAINYFTSSAVRMTIKVDTGNVGIGTVSPSGKLEIRTDAGSNYIFSGSSSSGYTSRFQMDDTALYIGHDSSVRSFTLRTNSSDRLTITGGGNVGVGSTIPSSKFEVLTSAVSLANQPNIIGNFKGDTDGRSLIRVENTFATQGAAALQAGISFVAYSTSSNQPSTNKHEAQIILGSTGATSVSGGQTGTLQIVAPLDIAFNVSASNTIMTGSSYTTFGSNAMYLARSGNVGIGTTTPNNKLHVYNSAGSSTTASNAIAVFEQNSNAGIQVCVPDASEAGLFFSRNGAPYYSAVTRNGTDLLLKNGSATAVTINSSRYVGIGTSSPSYILQVNGGATEVVGQVVASFEKQSATDGKIATFVNTTGSGYTSYIYIGSNPGRDWKIGKNVLNVGTTGHFQITNDLNQLKMQINASNDNVTFPSASVGIGTTSAAYILDAYQTSNDSILRSKTTTAGAYVYLDSGVDGYYGINLLNSGTSKWFMGGYNTGDYTITRGLNSTEYFRITAAGNVGIGTSNPAFLLDVSGSSRHGFTSSNTHQFTGSVSLSGGLSLTNLTSSNISASGTGSFGVVGIGTSVIDAKLTILGTSTQGTAYNAINLNNTDRGGATIGFKNFTDASTITLATINVISEDVGSGNYNDGVFTINTAADTVNSERFRITSRGQVGIGTTNPDIFARGYGKILGISGSTAAIELDSVGGTYLDLGVNGTRIGGLFASSIAYEVGTPGNFPMHFYTSGSYKMSVLANGNVGIGTTTPNSKLEVAGTAGTAIISVNNTSANRSGSFGIDSNGVYIQNSNNGDYFDLKNATGTSRFRLVYDNNTFLNTTYTSVGSLAASGSKLSVFGNLSVGSSYGSISAPSNGAIFQGGVGIGTTNPYYAFDVYTNSTAGALMSVRTSGSANARIYFDAANGDLTGGDYCYIGQESGSLNFVINTDVNSGNIHIQPRFGSATDGRLIVSGSSQFGRSAASTHQFTGSVSLSNGLLLTNLTASNVSASGTGSFGIVGIGTSTPFQKLSVFGSIESSVNTSTTGGPAYYIRYDGTGNYINSIGSEYSSGNTVLGFGATGKAGSAGYVSTFANFSGHRAVLMVGAGTLEFKNSRASLATAVGSDVPLTSSLYIDNSGNVGIGTTTANAKLNIASTSQTTKAIIQSVSAATGLGGYLAFNPGGDSSYSKVAIGVYDNYYSSFNRGNIAFMINSAADATEVGFPDTKMYISASGNVGIGTTSPAYKLDVQPTSSAARLGNAIVGALPFNTLYSFFGHNSLDHSSTANNYALLQFSDGTTYLNASATKPIYFRIGNSDKMILNSSGQLGIGTTSPITGYLDVRTNQTKSIAGPTNIAFFGSGDASNPLGLVINHESASAGQMIGLVGTEYGLSGKNIKINEALTVQYGGNVGIATTVPTAQLHICLDTVTFSSKNVARILNLGYSGITGAQNWTLRGVYQYAGGVAVNADGGDLDLIKSLDRNTILATKTDGTQLGNVGIGTTSPAFLLDVSGSSRHGFTSSNTHQFTGSVSFTDGLLLTNLTASNVSASGTGSFGIVGIGTTAPTALLHAYSSDGRYLTFSSTGLTIQRNIISTGAVSPTLTLINTQGSDSGTGRGSGIQFDLGYGGSGTVAGTAARGARIASLGETPYDATGSNQNASLVFYTSTSGSNTEKVRITSTGNVGIGTTVPTARLHVTGSTGGVFEVDTSGSATTFYVSASGNVGIGSASPAYKLDVAGGDVNFASNSILRFGTVGVLNLSSNANDIYANIRVIRNSSTTNQDGMYIGYDGTGTTGAHLRFYANGVTERMRIDASNGNVGIGITNPAAKLAVTGSGTGQMLVGDAGFGSGNYTGVSLNGTLNTTAYNFLSSPTDTNLYINRPSGNTIYFRENNSDQMVLLTGGNLGIGPGTPSAKVQISGSANSVLLNVKSPISGNIVYVTGSGAVGINTTTPAYTLQVNGSFAATTKSFVIDHPTKPDKKLVYGSLESPYHGIRLTGRDTLVDGKCVVELPDYISKLVMPETVNIQLTGIKCNKTLYVDDINISENNFTIAYDKGVFETYKDYDFFWDFTAVRADVPELQTEM